MESDKILVMDAGRAVEFAPPLALLKLEDGSFTNLLKQTGQESFDKLKRIAEEYAVKKGYDVGQMNVYQDEDNIVLDTLTNTNLVKEAIMGNSKPPIVFNLKSSSDVSFDTKSNVKNSNSNINNNINKTKIYIINENETFNCDDEKDKEDKENVIEEEDGVIHL